MADKEAAKEPEKKEPVSPIKPLFTASCEKYLNEDDDYEEKLPLDMQRVWRRMVRPNTTVQSIREKIREDIQDRSRDDRDDEVDDIRFDD